jgi:hypothetical protein
MRNKVPGDLVFFAILAFGLPAAPASAAAREPAEESRP